MLLHAYRLCSSSSSVLKVMVDEALKSTDWSRVGSIMLLVSFSLLSLSLYLTVSLSFSLSLARGP